MKTLNTLMTTALLAVSMYLTGCLEEELPGLQGRQTATAGEMVSGGSADETQPGWIDGDEDGEPGALQPEEPGEFDDEEDGSNSPICEGIDGEVALECEAGFRCVETCENDCEGEICPAICRISYRCEEDESAAFPDDDGFVDGIEPEEEDSGVSGAEPDSDVDGEPDEESVQPVSNLCLTIEGDVAFECEEGTACVEVCVNDCDGEMCPQICRIDYRCEDVEQAPESEPGAEGDGAVSSIDDDDLSDDEDGVVVGGGDEGDDEGDSNVNECGLEGTPRSAACPEGFRCEEQCINDCEGEVCPAICEIAFVCVADE